MLMRKRTILGAACAALLLVGAGCTAAKPSAQAPAANTAVQQESGMDKKTGDAQAQTAIGSPDAVVDSMLKDADAEKTAAADVEKNADDATADSAAVQAVSQNDYDLK